MTWFASRSEIIETWNNSRVDVVARLLPLIRLVVLGDIDWPAIAAGAALNRRRLHNRDVGVTAAVHTANTARVVNQRLVTANERQRVSHATERAGEAARERAWSPRRSPRVRVIIQDLREP